jgi:uncharacterized pyridoxal phosphate-dependent enzyme
MLGGGVAAPELARAIAAAVEDALTRPVDMARLKDELSSRIAVATGAEAGCVTSGAAAGIVLAVAACLAGESRQAVQQLPDGGRKPVVLQAGHDIDFGAPVTQMIRLGGGTVVVAGSPTRVTSADVERSLAWAAALLYVQSHHVAAGERVPLDGCVALAHAAGIPVIVDAAAEEDLRAYVAAGADLVIYSGGKALGGLSSSGFVAGRAGLIRAVRAQERGIGRPMKVGPEQLLSVAIALDLYETRAAGHEEAGILDAIMSAALELPGAEFEIADDEAGRPIRRVEVRTPRAIEVVEALRRNDPPIYVRAHHARDGRFAIDPRNVRAEDVEVVVEGLRRALSGSS